MPQVLFVISRRCSNHCFCRAHWKEPEQVLHGGQLEPSWTCCLTYSGWLHENLLWNLCHVGMQKLPCTRVRAGCAGQAKQAWGISAVAC